MKHEYFVIWFLDVNDARAKMERLLKRKANRKYEQTIKIHIRMEHLIKQTFFKLRKKAHKKHKIKWYFIHFATEKKRN